MEEFEIGGKLVTIFPSSRKSPVVYLNSYSHDEGIAVWDVLTSAVNLVVISSLDWNHDMTPWCIPPITKHSEPITGGADDYLSLLVDSIVPKAESMLGEITWRGITGYSLAGLFSIYALYRTDAFSAAASVSGSMWFPGFVDFVRSHEMRKLPDKLYFSLGDRERKTRNEVLASVEKNTRTISEYFKNKGINTVFRLNPGNHFADAALRTAKAIDYLAQEE